MTNPAPAIPVVFPGDGEMAARCRALDWAATALGPPADWPASLRTVVRTCLESPVPVNLWCGPALVLIYNDAYRRVLGAKHPHALGRPGLEVWAEIRTDLEEMFARLAAGGPAVYAEDDRFIMARAGAAGEDAWFTYGLSPVRDDAGAVVAYFNPATETTARVLAERRLTALNRALDVERARLAEVFRRAPGFMAVLRGPDHVFDAVNDAYAELVGPRDLAGRPLREALPEVAAQGFVELLDGVFATGAPYVGREVPIALARAPGAPPEERFVDFVYQPLVEADVAGEPRVTGVVAHGADMTAQVRARREVERLLGASERARAEAERARADAETAGRLKSEFLSTMSHEFRTPLNAILGYAQLLDLGILGATTPAQQAHLERLQASARHLLRLVDDVLDVAKVDADRLDVRRDVLATGAAVAAALALVQPQATAKGIHVEDQDAAGPGVAYVGDEHRVRQILVNLLSNAVKFTPIGGRVTVTSGTAAEPDPGVQPGGAGSGAPDVGAWAFVRVEDTGPGVAPALAGRLFEPFVQADGALTRAHGGTGLGLAISRRLARLMGGDLTAQHRPDSAAPGAQFTLWLPAPRGADAAGGEGVGRGRRQTPDGVTASSAGPGSATEVTEAALTPEAYAVLYALGARLAAQSESVSDRYVAALRADGLFPGARDLPASQLRDHTTPFVGLLASRLMTVGETRGRAPALLADGAQVQRVMAELHGAQRHRLGWAESDIEREMPLLRAEIERALSDAAREVGAAGRPGETTLGTDPAALDAASRYAADATRHVLDQATQTALRSYRFARGAAAP